MSVRQIALDTETTGLAAAAGHRITEIGCVEIINRKITGKFFSSYFNPEREVDEGAQRVTGLNLEFLKDYPLFKDVLPEIMQFIAGAELIIHNSQFDLSFINSELKIAKHAYDVLEQRHSIIDTLTMARKMHPGQKNNLDALCKRYQIDNSKRKKHGALLDAEILAELYLAMTAGQVSLNLGPGTAQTVDDYQNLTETIVLARGGKLPVIYADPQELDAHEKYLQCLRASNAKH